MGVSPVCRLASSSWGCQNTCISIITVCVVPLGAQQQKGPSTLQQAKHMPARNCHQLQSLTAGRLQDHHTWMLCPSKYVLTELAPQDRISGKWKDPSACEPFMRPLNLSVKERAPGAAAKPSARTIAASIILNSWCSGQICR